MELRDGLKVNYQIGFLKGFARVVGIAVIEQPVIGRMVILEDLSNSLPNKQYEYKYFVCPECNIRPIEEK